ncbi:hypothetical protein KBY66_12340 [Synechococcus sp. Tobar12-5m-g]|uniref:hypothetical protein n=1 Tax=unclassified Synechococcus TaxID=2626047 RepID=UPI0020CEBD10|nr:MULTISPECIES: hypothetical protein [unclassified Synechococcus]MCP9773399.1 hypothetical protein [Synechococcus sp. Tobar12-5m-g]MCP9874232.1 hypothetical protein [Synechococcus sp. Cruz CV-v-12]
MAELISGVTINLAMVEDGQAFPCRKYLGACIAREYLDAEFRASRRRTWVWLVPGGITRPWNFRRVRLHQSLPEASWRCEESLRAREFSRGPC